MFQAALRALSGNRVCGFARLQRVGLVKGNRDGVFSSRQRDLKKKGKSTSSTKIVQHVPFGHVCIAAVDLVPGSSHACFGVAMRAESGPASAAWGGLVSGYRAVQSTHPL